MNLDYDKVDKFAQKWHAGQTRKGNGEPYFNHVKRVAESVVDYFLPNIHKDVAYVIGIFHDFSEDTSISDKELKDFIIELGFDDYHVNQILEAINLLTRKNKADIDILSYLKRIKDNHYARIVKIADTKDNLRDLKPSNLRDKYELSLHFLEN